MKNAIVHISADHVCAIIKETADRMTLETGGVIAGEIIGRNEWLITHITLPGPKALHARFSFRPDYNHDENEIARIYQETNCKSIYLGDWHSHPGSSAYMSEKDREVLRTISKSTEARIPQPIMLVLGTFPFELSCWAYLKSKIIRRDFLSVSVTVTKN